MKGIKNEHVSCTLILFNLKTNKMKIKMMTLAAVFCCALSSTMFTACGSDDDDDDKVQVDETKPVGGVVDYGLVVNESMLSAFDLTVEYYDDNLQLQTEKLTQEEWKKTVKVSKLPASLDYRLKAKAKDGIDANFFQNKVGLYGYHYVARTVNAAGNNVDKVDCSDSEGARFSFEKKEFDSFLSQEDDVMISIHVDYNDNGRVKGNAWWTAKPLNIK